MLRGSGEQRAGRLERFAGDQGPRRASPSRRGLDSIAAVAGGFRRDLGQRGARAGSGGGVRRGR